MSYYWFNRQELLQKAKKKCGNAGKEKVAKYYHANKYVIKVKANSKHNNLTKQDNSKKNSKKTV